MSDSYWKHAYCFKKKTGDVQLQLNYMELLFEDPILCICFSSKSRARNFVFKIEQERKRVKANLGAEREVLFLFFIFLEMIKSLEDEI